MLHPSGSLISRLRGTRSLPVTQVNLRSITSRRAADGRDVFCKTSVRSLELEAEILSGEAGHRVGTVQAIPFVSYVRDRNELITEYVAGDNLFNVLWNGTSLVSGHMSPDAIGRAVLGVAEWLAAFHRRWREHAPGRTTAGGYRAGRVEAAVQEKLDRLASILPRTARSSGFIDRLRGRARSLAADPAWTHLGVSLIHGDFTTGNALVARDGRVYIGDFGDARAGFALEDVTRFWSSIWELGRCGRRRRALFEPLLDPILSINGLPATIRESAPFALMREFNSVTKLLEVESLRGRLGPATMFVVSRIGRVHRRWLEQCSAGPFGPNVSRGAQDGRE